MKNKKYMPKYPLIWQKHDFYIKIYCSIPNIATGIVLTTDGSMFVIDPGDGILRDLNKDYSKDEILEISDIFISHGHHDHVGGVWSLLTYLYVMRRTDSLNLHFPKGCAEIESIHKAFLSVYGADLPYEINLIEIDIPEVLEINSVKVEPFKVNHREPLEDGTTEEVPSLGFKFSYADMSICYGGDTAYCESLVEIAKDSDLAIIEAGADDEKESELHMTMDQAIEIGKTAKDFFLVHVPEK